MLHPAQVLHHLESLSYGAIHPISKEFQILIVAKMTFGINPLQLKTLRHPKDSQFTFSIYIKSFEINLLFSCVENSTLFA